MAGTWNFAIDKLSAQPGQAFHCLEVTLNTQTKTFEGSDFPIDDFRAAEIHGIGIGYTAIGAGTRDFVITMSYLGLDVFTFPLDSTASAAGASTTYRECIQDLQDPSGAVAWGVAPNASLFHFWPKGIWLISGMILSIEAYNNLNVGDDMNVFIHGIAY